MIFEEILSRNQDYEFKFNETDWYLGLEWTELNKKQNMRKKRPPSAGS